MASEINSDHVEVIKSNKGHYKIIHKGFMYTKHKSFNNVTRWRCAARGSCRGSIMTSNDFTQPTPKMAHTHPADYRACEVAKARYLIPKVNNFVFKTEHFQSAENTDTFPQTNVDVLPSIVRTEPNLGGVRYVRKDGTEVIVVNEAPTHFMDILLPPANSAQQQPPQPQQLTPQPSPQAQPQPSPPPVIAQKKSGLPPLAPKPTGAKLPQQAGSSSATIKQLPKLLPKPQSPPEVCLRWNSYHSNMQNTFPSLLNNEQFVDVTLACDGRSIKCHKVMLSACSPYMEELLSSNPCQHPIIFLKDMKFWQLQALIDFMYRGEVNVTQDKLPSLLSAAEALQIKGLASPVNHSAPPKITQVQPMATAQHDISEDMDQVTYMRHLQLQTDIKSEYEDEYMQDTDESPPPTPKAKKRKQSHPSMPHTSGTSNGPGGGGGSAGTVGGGGGGQHKATAVNKPKRDKERLSEPSTSQQALNSAQGQPNQTDADHLWKSENDKMTDSENEYKNYSEDNRHSTAQDEELDLDEKHAQIILERYSSQNDDYSRGGDGDADADMDDNSTTSG